MKRLLLILFILFPMLLSAQNLVHKKHPKRELYGYWGTKRNGKEGFVISPKYEKVTPFVNNHAFVCKKGVWYMIGVNGNAISDVTYSNVELLMPDIYHYRVWQEGKCGLVDATGKFLIPLAYDAITTWQDGGYLLEIDGRLGLADATGKNVLPVKYDEIIAWSHGGYLLKRNDKCGLVDAAYREVLPVAYDEISAWAHGGYLLKRNEKCGLADAAYREVLPVEYDEISAWAHGGYLLKRNGKCGLADAAYREVLPVAYDEISTWPQGGYLLRRNGKCGLIDDLYKEILPVKYDKFYVREQGGYTLLNNSRIGIADANGKELISPEYKKIHHLIWADMYALFGDEWSFVNGSGQIVDVSNRAMYYTTNNGKELICNGLGDHRNLFCEGKGVLLFDAELKEIGERAFYNYVNLTSITIPNGVTAIDNSAFHYCRNLASITIPDNVAGVNPSAFEGCDSLPIVDGIRYAGTYLLEVVNKYYSTYIIKPETRFICDGAFEDCIHISSIVIPDNVISIGHDAFAGCSSLKSMTFGKSIAHLGLIFGNYSPNENIESIYISDIKSWCQLDFDVGIGILGIESSNPMFANAELYLNNQPITDLVIPSGVTYIGSYAFYNCRSLTSVEVPLGVEGIDVGTFAECKNLTKVTLPNSVAYIGEYAFMNCENLSEITVPRNTVNIATDAFWGCSSLPTVDNIRYVGPLLVEVADKSKRSYTIKSGTRFIGNRAFANCIYLESITIPASVEAMGLGAFEGCESLQSFYCKPTTPPEVLSAYEGGCRGDIWQSFWSNFLEDFPFREIETKIYVPKKSEWLYREDYGWMHRSQNIVGYNF